MRIIQDLHRSSSWLSRDDLVEAVLEGRGDVGTTRVLRDAHATDLESCLVGLLLGAYSTASGVHGSQSTTRYQFGELWMYKFSMLTGGITMNGRTRENLAHNLSAHVYERD